ncbi:beta-1,3-galactosyltransferase 4-like isoform X2 [Cherax quadricarinatus]
MHKQRFRFIHGKIKVNLTAPKVNLIPEHVRWRHPLNQATPCHDGSSQPLVLALVPSAPGNRRGRNFIRSTWAHPALYPRTGLKVLFVVGLTQDAELQDALDTEAALFHDLIQNTFVDSYRNLTYKAISWLSWVSQHCTHVPFIAKVDDDVLVNPYCLGKYLRGLFSVTTPKTPASNDTLASPPRLSTSSSNQQLSLSVNSTGSLSDDGSLSLTPTDYIYGRLQTRSSPHRRGKWSLAIEEYPENIFPPFVLGPAYIVGAHAVRRLLKYVAQTPFLWLEDVFTTGLVAHLAHVPHVQTEFLYTGNPSVELFYGQKAFMTETSEDKRRYGWEGIKKFSHTEDNHKS